jgi:ABC-type Fe3+-hydroxamate transport system substrate-binding protein
MVVYKITNTKDGKVYVGYSHNDNPNNFGTGKYIKRAVRDLGADSFEREVIDYFDDSALEEVLQNVERWIKAYQSDNPKYGYNERAEDCLPQKRRLTKKLQVLITPQDEEVLSSILIRKSMENGTKPISISKYVRQLIKLHIVKETSNEHIIDRIKIES